MEDIGEKNSSTRMFKRIIERSSFKKFKSNNLKKFKIILIINYIKLMNYKE